jgi:hypothetical protein
MCSAPAQAVSKTPQFFYQKANQLGKEAVFAAPKATATLLTVAPFALYMFQPEGMLNQALTLAATTGTVLYAPRIYNYVYNHPLTAQVCKKVCAQPFVQQICDNDLVQQGTAAVSGAIQCVSSFVSKVEDKIVPYLFPQAMPETHDEDDHEDEVAEKHSGDETKAAKPDDKTAKSTLAMQLDTLKRAFKAVPTATAATLAVNLLALRFFQPEGILTQFATLTGASGAFFTGTKLYGKYHNHPAVQNLWKHPAVTKVSNHPVVVKGTAFASGTAHKVSAFAKAAKEAYGRAFYPKPQRESMLIVHGPVMSYEQFEQILLGQGSWVRQNECGILIPKRNLPQLHRVLKSFPDSPQGPVEEDSVEEPTEADGEPQVSMKSSKLHNPGQNPQLSSDEFSANAAEFSANAASQGEGEQDDADVFAQTPPSQKPAPSPFGNLFQRPPVRLTDGRLPRQPSLAQSQPWDTHNQFTSPPPGKTPSALVTKKLRSSKSFTQES